MKSRWYSLLSSKQCQAGYNLHMKKWNKIRYIHNFFNYYTKIWFCRIQLYICTHKYTITMRKVVNKLTYVGRSICAVTALMTEESKLHLLPLSELFLLYSIFFFVWNVLDVCFWTFPEHGKISTNHAGGWVTCPGIGLTSKPCVFQWHAIIPKRFFTIRVFYKNKNMTPMFKGIVQILFASTKNKKNTFLKWLNTMDILLMLDLHAKPWLKADLDHFHHVNFFLIVSHNKTIYFMANHGSD